jgi:hypothetical protein
MRAEDQEALVAELAADFPVFSRSTIARWVSREAARHEAAPAGEVAGLVERAVRTTVAELSRDGVTTSHELPVAHA